MNVRNATKQQIEQAAATVGVNVYNLRPTGSKPTYGRHPVDESGSRWSFTLHPGKRTETYYIGPRGGTKKRAKYQRITQRQYRRADGSLQSNVVPAAVCWHGHRDFFRALFALAPDAIVRTAMATYKGAEHFERTFPATYYQGGERMGIALVPYANACRCEE